MPILAENFTSKDNVAVSFTYLNSILTYLLRFLVNLTSSLLLEVYLLINVKLN